MRFVWPTFVSKLRGGADKFGGQLSVEHAIIPLKKWPQSQTTCKHKIHQTYYQILNSVFAAANSTEWRERGQFGEGLALPASWHGLFNFLSLCYNVRISLLLILILPNPTKLLKYLVWLDRSILFSSFCKEHFYNFTLCPGARLITS